MTILWILFHLIRLTMMIQTPSLPWRLSSQISDPEDPNYQSSLETLWSVQRFRSSQFFVQRIVSSVDRTLLKGNRIKSGFDAEWQYVEHLLSVCIRGFLPESFHRNPKVRCSEIREKGSPWRVLVWHFSFRKSRRILVCTSLLTPTSFNY